MSAGSTQAQSLIEEISDALRLKDEAAAGQAGAKLEALLPELSSTMRDPALAAFLKLAELKIVTGQGGYSASSLLAQAHELVDTNEHVVVTARAALAELDARLLKFQNQWTESLPFYQRAIDELMPFKDDAEIAAQLVVYLGNKADAEEKAGHLQDAIAANEAALGLAADAVTESAILSNLGRALAGFGRYRDAVARHEQSLGIRRTIPQAEALVAESLALMASALADLGDYRRADPAFAEAQAAYEQIQDGEADVARVLLNYAVYRVNHRQFVEADAALSRAQSFLKAVERVPVETRVQVAEVIASLAEEQGNPAMAIILLTEAIAQITNLNLAHPALPVLRRELADAHLRAGDVAKANLEVDGAIGDLDSSPDSLLARAALLGSRSAIRHAERRYDDAIADAEEALGLIEGRVGSSHFVIADLRDNVVFPLAAADRYADALSQAEKAESIRDDDLDAMFSSQTEAERLRTLDAVRAGLDVFLTLARRLQDDPARPSADSDTVGGAGGHPMARAFELVLRRQAIVAESTALALSPPLQDSPAAAQAARLRLVRAELGRQVLSVSPDRDRIAALQGQRNELELALADVYALVGFVRGMRTATAGLVAASLPPNSVLINFLVYRPIDFKAPAWTANRAGNERYLAFILRPGPKREVVLHDLGPCGPIDAAIESWRSLIDPPAGVEPAEVVAAAAEPVASFVLEPLLADIDGAKHLVIVADGALARVPFAALPIDGERLVVDEFVVSHADSGRDLISWSRKSAGKPGPVYVAGGIDYDADPPGPKTEPVRPALPFLIGHFGYLSGTLTEVEPIAALYGVPAETGAQPSEGRLKSLESPVVLHLATHGYFLPPGLAETVPNPMLRAGVVLASFNRALDGSSMAVEMQDGALNAEDVLEMSLSSTEMVVLSACETGLGDVRACEGVFGLRRSFAIAGVDALVMSLWQVPDQETATLMIEFHQMLKDGKHAAEALHDAMKSVRAASKHMHNWAAFILAGRPGPIATLWKAKSQLAAAR
jgi:CHAT domain-containing protein/tetratricopeptide (TPR) repeat protein